jgi:hypothetical protein
MPIILPGLTTPLEPGEPIFIIRGKDPVGAIAIRRWIDERRKTAAYLNDKEELRKLQSADEVADEMDEWRKSQLSLKFGE